MRSVIALYDELDAANAAIKELNEAGIDPHDITVLAGDPEQEYAALLAGEDGAYDETAAALDGAAAGGVIGALAGILFGLSAFIVPGLGPIVVAGPVITTLLGAGVGAASGGLIAALVAWGVSEDEAQVYAEAIRRGGVLLVVPVVQERAETVAEILDAHGPVDLEARITEWKEDGWSGDSDKRYAGVAFDTHDRAFRQHYEENYAGTQSPYTNYTPAYQFGHFLATQDRFIDRDWHEMEPEARRLWEEHHDEPWQEYEGAIQFSWQRAQLKII